MKSCFTEDFVSQPLFSEEKLKLFVNNLRTPHKFEFFDRHMSIKFDYPSQSRAPFAGERRFSKSRGLSASGSFLPLPYPPLSFFGSRPIFRAAKTPKIPFLSLSLLPNPTETLATQAMKVVYMSICLSVCLFNESVLNITYIVSCNYNTLVKIIFHAIQSFFFHLYSLQVPASVVLKLLDPLFLLAAYSRK